MHLGGRAGLEAAELGNHEEPEATTRPYAYQRNENQKTLANRHKRRGESGTKKSNTKVDPDLRW